MRAVRHSGHVEGQAVPVLTGAAELGDDHARRQIRMHRRDHLASSDELGVIGLEDDLERRSAGHD